ncbi:MAG: lipopolysaccharide transport periplasmic protein LptA [Aquisalimonadaceae bacterium]
MSRMLNSLALALGLAITVPTLGTAQQTRDLPIHLDADTADIDGTRGVGVYTGNVVLTQGNREITGDRMTVHTRDGRELDYVVVEGTPATWEQPPESGGDIIRGEAPRMEYHARNPTRVKLLQGGRITQGRNTFTGETIEYNLETENVIAQGRDSSERVRITLFPEDENSQ